MAKNICPECNAELVEDASSCPNCDSKVESSLQGIRQVSNLLAFGILLFPLIFSWFTLRKNHTAKARVISFVWMIAVFSAPFLQEGAINDSIAASNTADDEELVICYFQSRNILTNMKLDPSRSNMIKTGTSVAQFSEFSDVLMASSVRYESVSTDRSLEISKKYMEKDMFNYVITNEVKLMQDCGNKLLALKSK